MSSKRSRGDEEATTKPTIKEFVKDEYSEDEKVLSLLRRMLVHIESDADSALYFPFDGYSDWDGVWFELTDEALEPYCKKNNLAVDDVPHAWVVQDYHRGCTITVPDEMRRLHSGELLEAVQGCGGGTLEHLLSEQEDLTPYKLYKAGSAPWMIVSGLLSAEHD